MFLGRHGVPVSASTTFNAAATHVVAQRLTRSEKLLGAIASGRWVLHHSYIRDCLQEDRLLQEADYEWGNPRAGFLAQLEGEPLERQLADAAYRWRRRVSSGECEGAFAGLKVKKHTVP